MAATLANHNKISPFQRPSCSDAHVVAGLTLAPRAILISLIDESPEIGIGAYSRNKAGPLFP
jgi:hypothetical protein